MRYWTVQPLTVWETVQTQGYCDVDPEQTLTGSMPESYDWLVAQLRRRLPGYSGGYPWWLYCERPDLRRLRWTRPEHAWEVRLELELPDERVERFLIRDWNIVYGGRWLTRRRPEEDWFRFRELRGWEDIDPPPAWQALLEASWQRLFDPRRHRHKTRGRFEAVTERIYREDVIQASVFRGLNPKYRAFLDQAAAAAFMARS